MVCWRDGFLRIFTAAFDRLGKDRVDEWPGGARCKRNASVIVGRNPSNQRTDQVHFNTGTIFNIKTCTH